MKNNIILKICSLAIAFSLSDILVKAQSEESVKNWSKGSASIDFIPSNELSEEEYSSLQESCARLGSQGCFVRFAGRIVKSAIEAADNKFANDEFIYILRQGICPVDRTAETRDNHSERELCESYNHETGENLAIAYEAGLFGLPKSIILSECWRDPLKAKYLECLKLEQSELGGIPAGTRPKGFSTITVFP